MRSGTRIVEILDFNDWLRSLPHKRKIVIAGNHDLMFERKAAFAISSLSAATYLQDSGSSIAGIRFWGSPYTPEFCNWAFNRQRGVALKRHWDKIPADTDILITHGPPLHILDHTEDSEHLGCADLLDAVQRIGPAIHIFGHIHCGFGQFNQTTQFYNAAVMDESYNVVNPATVIDL